MPHPQSLFVAVLFAHFLMASTSGAAGAPEADAFTPQFRPVLEIQRAAGPIAIDGALNDPGWRGAARAGGFSETDPGDNTRPPIDTEVWITYDAENIYFAYMAHDDPAEVRASMSDRDAIWEDDYIGIILDTFGTANWAYELFINPLGIQGDLRWMSGGEEDLLFDLVWRSMGRVTDRGYQVEVAVPFSSLRFPEAPEQVWRATFWRNRPRESRCRYSWAAIDRDEPCWTCNFGTLRGIADVRPGRTLEFLPAIVASSIRGLRDPHDTESGLGPADPNLEGSLGVRWGARSNLSLEATVNPDFSQVESDPAEIDVNTTFAIFYPEKRPFFQEGGELFSSWIQGVYTRTINDPIAAWRLTGRSGRSSIAYIGARDREAPLVVPFTERSGFIETGRSVSNIARFRRVLGADSHIGGLITHRLWDDRSSGALASIDGSLRFLRNYRFDFQAARSRTEEPEDSTMTAAIGSFRFDGGKHTAAFDGERFDGHALHLSFNRDARLWNASLSLREKSPTFRVANGFLARNDNREAELWSGVFFRSEHSIFQQVSPMIDMARVWDFDGVPKDEWLVPELSVLLRGQTSLSVEYLWSHERFGGIEFPGIRRYEFSAQNKYFRSLQSGFGIEHGRTIARGVDPPVLGRSTDVNLNATIHPTPRLLIEPEYRWSRMRSPDGESTIYDGYILRTRGSYQFTRRTHLRLVVQYDRFDDALAVEPLVTYKANPFTIFYLGWTELYGELRAPGGPFSTKRQLFLKFQYMVQT